MVMQWGLFVMLAIVTYIGISVFSQLTASGSQTALGAFFSALRPLPLVILIIANMFFAAGLHYGFEVTRFAIPVALSMGVIISFVYSVAMLGASVTMLKLAGITLIILGIATLSAGS